MPIYRPDSATRLTALVVGLSLLVGAAIALAFYRFQRADVVANLTERTRIAGQMLAFTTAAGLEFEDTDELAAALTTLRGNPEIVYAEVRNAEGETIISLATNTEGPLPTIGESSEPPSDVFLVEEVPVRGLITSDNLGTVRVGASDKALRRFQQRSLYNAVAILFIGTAFAAMISLYLISQFLRRREAELALAGLAQAIPGEAAVFGLDGRCEFVFGEAETSQKPLIVGKTIDQILGPEISAPVEAAIERTINTNRQQRVEYQRVVDGGPHWLEGRLAPVTGSSGRVERVILVSYDISGRKEAEVELERYRQHLEELVSSRTRELESVNRELESFSYSVSHDLRAPLRAIDGFSEALSEDYDATLDDRGQHYLGRIRGAVRRMGTLIEDLLRLSRVSRSEMELIKVDLSHEAHAIADELRAGDPERDAVFEIEEGVEAFGDPTLLHVVLSNLLGNAWKYTTGTENARIEFGCQAGESGPIYFVRDNGAGFDMRFADKLFGVFQRLHSEEEFPGTGVGLATVQRIIIRHGGRVWANSRPGEGATFYFTLQSRSDAAA